ncbi:MAG TPA: type IX secretion system protein PorQ [Bacteroidales bacterium]|nr:type IX secretion system protein PorQ [Bacteroidales bacterium]
MNVFHFSLSLPTIPEAMPKKFVIGFFLVCSMVSGYAQLGKNSVYNLLNYSYSARNSGLGGGLISAYSDDPTLLFQNPSTISDRFHTSLGVNFVDYFSNVAYGSAFYSHTFKKWGSFAFEMRYVGFGTFTQTDESGNVIGSFTAGDYAGTIGWGRKLSDKLSLGANLKLIYSGYETYTSFGLATDVAGTYYDPDKMFSMSVLFKNMGSQIVTYTPGKYEKLPFDIQFALSKRLEHVPVRLHLSLHSLYKWDMTYEGDDDPLLEMDAITGDYKYPSSFSQQVNNFFRHFIFGIEILPSENFSLFASFNYNRNQEMYIPQNKSAAGFSYGFAFNIKTFRFSFARSHFAVGAAPITINLASNINDLIHLKKPEKKLKRITPQN